MIRLLRKSFRRGAPCKIDFEIEVFWKNINLWNMLKSLKNNKFSNKYKLFA